MEQDPRQTGLFDAPRSDAPLGPGAMLLAGFAEGQAAALLDEISQITAAAPFRYLTVPGGHTMSVAMTNCGGLGWVSDRRGYRYEAADPGTGRPWPLMPPRLAALAREAAARAGYDGFSPDACLINRYAPGARMGLHQDKDEKDLSAPIVSVSIGLPATFLWGGVTRRDPTGKLLLLHGDVVVFGGASRLAYHGVAPLRDGDHPLTGPVRYNLTFRRVT